MESNSARCLDELCIGGILAFWNWLKSLFSKSTGIVVAPAPAVKVSETHWMEIAQAELGQSEIAGEKDNARIVEYHKATTLKASDDETPWCSSFVCWVLAQAGYKSTKDAWARSFLKYGTKLDQPKFGCIVIYRRGKDSGHVHFFVKQDEDYIYGLGGNQGNKVSIKAYSKSDVLGYRWPVKA